MPIRARVQRLWRLVVEWWRPSRASTSQPPASPPPATPPKPTRRRSPTRRSAPVPTAPRQDGEPLVGGAVTVRMWIVGGRLVLATSRTEAEQALRSLLTDLSPEEQPAARALLDALQADFAAAA